MLNGLFGVKLWCCGKINHKVTHCQSLNHIVSKTITETDYYRYRLKHVFLARLGHNVVKHIYEDYYSSYKLFFEKNPTSEIPQNMLYKIWVLKPTTITHDKTDLS